MGWSDNQCNLQIMHRYARVFIEISVKNTAVCEIMQCKSYYLLMGYIHIAHLLLVRENTHAHFNAFELNNTSQSNMHVNGTIIPSKPL